MKAFTEVFSLGGFVIDSAWAISSEILDGGGAVYQAAVVVV